MKFISDDRNYDPYMQYLESVKDTMPRHMFEFASNTENHNLESPNSLHDSWLEYWRISEVAMHAPRRARRVQIEACFLGPRHDRYIYLHYKNVEKHSIGAGYERALQHGDLLVHELTIARDGVYSHELLFASGAVFTVYFADFEHRIAPIIEPRA